MFFEYISVTPKIYIFGTGHVGKALLYHLSNLDYDITVINYRSKGYKELLSAYKIEQKNYIEFIKKEKINDDSYVILA